ncbi:MAG: hypothetical protein ACJ8AP_04900, partial [Gemmatimonadales bacterium]
MTELAIGLALGLLILVPVVEFVTRGNAEGVARLLTGAWIPRLRLALLERSLFHWHRKLHEERHQRWLLLQKAQAVIGQHASSVAELRVLAGDTNDPHVKKVAEEHL